MNPELIKCAIALMICLILIKLTNWYFKDYLFRQIKNKDPFMLSLIIRGFAHHQNSDRFKYEALRHLDAQHTLCHILSQEDHHSYMAPENMSMELYKAISKRVDALEYLEMSITYIEDRRSFFKEPDKRLDILYHRKNYLKSNAIRYIIDL